MTKQKPSLHSNSHDQVAVAILAAGASTRFESPKQFIKFGGQTLLCRAAAAALACDCREVIVVLGSRYDRMRQELGNLPLRTLRNELWQEGMSSSLHCVIRYLKESAPAMDAVLFMTVDQPHVSSRLLNEMISARHYSRKAIVACQYEQVLGVPALFARSMLAELERAKGDKGARDVIRAHADQVLAVPFPQGALDIDDRTDYQNLMDLGKT